MHKLVLRFGSIYLNICIDWYITELMLHISRRPKLSFTQNELDYRLWCKNNISAVWCYNSYLYVSFPRWRDWLTFLIVKIYTDFVTKPDFLHHSLILYRKYTSSTGFNFKYNSGILNILISGRITKTCE